MKKCFVMILILVMFFLSLSSVKAAGHIGQLGEAYNDRIGRMSEEEQEQQKLQALYEGDEQGYHRFSFSIGNESSVGIMGPEGLILYEQQEGEEILFYADGFFLSQDENDTYLKTVEGETVFSA